MYYRYKDSIITVRPGLGQKNYATCIRKKSGGWKTVVAKDMPRVSEFDKAINNLHSWAEKKKLKKAECGCCWHCINGHCTKYDKALCLIEANAYLGIPVYERVLECTDWD